VPGLRFVISAATGTGLEPSPGAGAQGTEEVYVVESPYSIKHTVTSKPFGLTLPASVALVWVTAVGAVVVTDGATGATVVVVVDACVVVVVVGASVVVVVVGASVVVVVVGASVVVVVVAASVVVVVVGAWVVVVVVVGVVVVVVGVVVVVVGG